MIDPLDFQFKIGMALAFALGAGTLVGCWWIVSIWMKGSPGWAEFKDKWMMKSVWTFILCSAVFCMWVGFKNVPTNQKPVEGELKSLNTKIQKRQDPDTLGSGDRLQESGQDSLDKFRKRALKGGKE